MQIHIWKGEADMCENDELMQRRIKQVGVLKYEDERLEALRTEMPELQTDTILGYHEHVLTPIKCSYIQKELRKGPPLFMSKAKKSEWRSKRETLLADAEARKKFFKPAKVAVKDMREGLDRLKVQEEESNRAVSTAEYIKLLNSANKEAAKEVDNIYGGEDERICALMGILKELSSCKAKNDLKQEQMIKLVEDYLALKGELGQENMADANLLREASRNKYSFENSYVFLFHSVTAMLSELLNGLPMEQVNTETFAKLQGWIAASGALSSAVKLSRNYKDKKNRYQKELEEEAVRKEHLKQELEEMVDGLRQYLHPALEKEGIRGTDYTEIIENAISSIVSSATTEWIKIVNGNPIEVFENNLALVKSAIESNPELVVPKLGTMLLEYIIRGRLGALLQPMEPADVQKLVNGAVGEKSNKEQIKKYKKRVKLLTDNSGLKQFDYLLEIDKIAELVSADNSEEEYRESVNILSMRAVSNIEQAEALLAENISSLNRGHIMEILMKREYCGISFLFGTRRDVFTKVKHYLSKDALEKFVPGICETEQKVRKAIKASKLSPMWEKIGCASLSATDSEEVMIKKLKNVRIDMDLKLSALARLTAGTRYKADVWERLVRWQNKHLDRSVTAFTKGMKKQLFLELMPEKKVTPDNFSYDEYMKHIEAGKATEQIRPVEEADNRGLLRHGQLCEWEGFSGLLEEYEDEVMQALGTLLAEGRLKHSFLGKVKYLDDLNSLTYEEFQMLVNRLRVNMGRALQGWSSLEGFNSRQVKINLLPELLEGTLNEENIHERAEQASVELENTENARAMRFSFLMDSEQIPVRGNLQYQYIDDSDSTAAFTKRTRAQRRIARFDTAAKVWDALDVRGDLVKVLEEADRLSNGDKNSAAASKDISKLQDFILDTLKKHKDSGTKELCKELAKKGGDGYGYEFRLCGLEEFLLAKENNQEAHLKFTSRQRDEYEQALYDIGHLSLQRMLDVERYLVNTGLDEAKRKELRARMRPLIAGIAEGTDAKTKEENRKRFGVESWNEAIRGMCIRVNDLMDPTKKMNPGELQVKEGIELVAERQKQLSVYKGRILQPILPRLFKDDEFWRAMVTENQVSFAKRVEEIYKKVETPLMLLNYRYAYGEEFKNQLVNELGDRMLYDNKLDRNGWKELCDEYFERYCRHLVYGVSITKRFEELKKKNLTMASYFTEVMLTHPDGVNLLLNDKALDSAMQLVKANDDTLKEYLTNKPGLSESDKVGIRMYLQTKVVCADNEEFKQGLDSWIEGFYQLKQETFEQTVQTKAVMDRRVKMHMDVTEHRNAGITEDGEENLALREMRARMHSAGSPLLVALGVEKGPTADNMRAAKKTLAQYGKLPKKVADCLLERILSGAKKETLDKDAEWLKRTNQLVEGLKIDEFTRTANIEGELLMFLYINQRDKELTTEQVSEEYDRLKKRHVMVSGLMDQQFAQAMRFRPDFWSMKHRKPDSRSKLSLEKTENPVLTAERRAVVEAMTVGIYTMKDEDFERLIEKKTRYFDAAAAADNVFGKLIDQYIQDEKEKQAVRIGLKEYFHADIVKGRDGIDEEQLAAKVKEMLEDTDYRRCLTTGTLMEGISFDSLRDNENTLHTVANRKTLENLLAAKRNNEYREAYNKLDISQRQVFALAVLRMDRIDQLPGARYVCSSELFEGRHKLIDRQLKQYTSCGDFQPQIAYDRVVDILCRADGSIDKEVFKEAMEMTIGYVREHQDNSPKDWLLLSDGENTLNAAARILKDTDPSFRVEAPENVSTLTKMREWIIEQDITDAVAEEQKKRLAAMDDYSLQLLAEALQDRTMLDHTTRIKRDNEAEEFANPKKRELFKDNIQTGNLGERLYSTDLTNAVVNLMSYQLRDDIELSRIRLSKSDFAPKALERKTKLDWSLLKRAMDFVEQIGRV